METVIIFLTDYPGALAASFPLHTCMHMHTDIITPGLIKISGEISDHSNCTQTPSDAADLQVDYETVISGNKVVQVVP